MLRPVAGMRGITIDRREEIAEAERNFPRACFIGKTVTMGLSGSLEAPLNGGWAASRSWMVQYRWRAQVSKLCEWSSGDTVLVHSGSMPELRQLRGVGTGGCPPLPNKRSAERPRWVLSDKTTSCADSRKPTSPLNRPRFDRLAGVGKRALILSNSRMIRHVCRNRCMSCSGIGSRWV